MYANLGRGSRWPLNSASPVSLHRGFSKRLGWRLGAFRSRGRVSAPVRAVWWILESSGGLPFSSRNCRGSRSSFSARPLYFFFHTGRRRSFIHNVVGVDRLALLFCCSE